jgi:1-acyl-sn-glycerol-3-phosphate acyltransferase
VVRFAIPIQVQKLFNIQETTLIGENPLPKLLKDNKSVVLLVNHPGHGDYSLVPWVAETPMHYLVAKEGVPENFWPLMKRALGLLPVRRGALDADLLMQTRRIVGEGKHPLVIFPEGMITNHSAQIRPLMPGAASIASGAAADAEKNGKQVILLPLGIRHRYLEDISVPFNQKLGEIERRLHLDSPPTLSACPKVTDDKQLDRLQTVRNAVLDQLSEEYLGQAYPLPVADKHRALQADLLQQVEQRLEALIQNVTLLPKEQEKLDEITKPGGRHTALDRLRLAERRFEVLKASQEKQLKQSKKKQDPEASQLEKTVAECHKLEKAFWRLDALFQAPTDYLNDLDYARPQRPPSPENRTPERMAEGLLFAYTLLEGKPAGIIEELGPREARMQFGEPIPVANVPKGPERRAQKEYLTRQAHQALQQLVAQL